MCSVCVEAMNSKKKMVTPVCKKQSSMSFFSLAQMCLMCSSLRYFTPYNKKELNKSVSGICHVSVGKDCTCLFESCVGGIAAR